MKTYNISNWKKNRNECVFHVITNCGKKLMINDYSDNIAIKIEDTEDLKIKVLEFSNDYQYNLPENERIKGKKSDNEIDKCEIIGNEVNVNNLLFSIGWSSKDNFHIYKNPLTESLIDELNQIKWSVEESIEEYKKLKNLN